MATSDVEGDVSTTLSAAVDVLAATFLTIDGGGTNNSNCRDAGGGGGGPISLGASIAVASLVTPVAAFGLVGNALVLLSFCLPTLTPTSLGRRLRGPRVTSTSVFFSTLAVCDELTIILCIGYELLSLAAAVRRATGETRPTGGRVVVACAALLGLIQLTVTWSTWLIAAIAYFRYCIVTKPDQTLAKCSVAKARKYAVGATIVAIVLSIPAFVRFKVEERRCGNETWYDFHLNEFAGYAVYKVLYSYVIYFTFSYVIPITLLLFLSARLIASLLRSRDASQTIVATPHLVARARQQHVKVTKVSATIAVLNVVCMAPSFAQAVVREEAGVDSAAFRATGTVARSLLVIVSAVDCVLLSFVSKSFRRRLSRGSDGGVTSYRAPLRLASERSRSPQSPIGAPSSVCSTCDD